VTVSYGFDRTDLEADPSIDDLCPITEEGQKLFPLIEEILNHDSAYVERLKAHYRMVKARIAQGSMLLH
jgi:hypothetical protein